MSRMKNIIRSPLWLQEIKKVTSRRREVGGSTRARLGIDDTVFWKRVAREYVVNEEAKLETHAGRRFCPWPE